jgi:2C-methyl-D-erythritol 2,4-cyclodiphosphate synthase
MSHATRRNHAPALSTTRDKVSNGRLFQSLDLRSAGARRFKVLVDAYSAELGGELSEAERSLVRQAAALQIQGEKMQEQIVQGLPIDPDQLIRVSSTSKRLLSIIAAKTGKRDQPDGPSVEDLFAVPDDDADEAGAE